MVEKNQFDLLASSYMNKCSRGAWGLLKRWELKALIPFLKTKEDCQVLDLGCGPGFYSLKVREFNPLCKILGVDGSVEMIREYEDKGFSGFHHKLEELELPSQKFDLVLALGIFEFVPSPENLTFTISNSLKTTGKLVILVPSSNAFNQIYKWYHQLNGIPIQLRPPKVYQDLFQRMGLDPVETSYPTPFCKIMVFRKP